MNILLQKRLVGGLLAAGLLSAALPGQAQVYRRGWLLPAQGDTLRGEIEDAAWEAAPTRVRFRAAPGALIASYPAAEVRAFYLQGGQYFRLETLPLDRDAQLAPNRLSEVATRNQQPEALLAEVLLDGAAKLLHTTVGDVQHYFVQRPGQPWLELSERGHLRLENGQRFFVDDNNYRGELLQYFGDCPALTQRLADAPFTKAGLVALLQVYNKQCAPAQQASTVYEARRTSSLGLRLAVVAGARYNTGQLQAPAYHADATLDGQNLDGTVHPLGGLVVELLPPGRRVALVLAGLATQVGRSATLAVKPEELTTQLDTRLTVLELRAGGRYFFKSGRHDQQFFAGAGFALVYAPSKDSGTITYSGASQGTPYVSSAPNAYPPGSVLPYLEAGVRRHRFGVQLDVRWQRAAMHTLYTTSPSPPPPGLPYTFTSETYTYRNWYAGAALAFYFAQPH